MKKLLNNPKQMVNIILITLVIGIISLIVGRCITFIPMNNTIAIGSIRNIKIVDLILSIVICGMLMSIVYFGVIKFKGKINSKKMNILLLTNFLCIFAWRCVVSDYNFNFTLLFILIFVYLALLLYMPLNKPIYKPNILCILFIVAYCLCFVQPILKVFNPNYLISYRYYFALNTMLNILSTIYLLPIANYFRLYGNRRKENE